MYLFCRPDLGASPFIKVISDFVLITWSLKYGFWSDILNSTLLITYNDIKTSIRSVGQIWVHLLKLQQSLIFAFIIWSSKFGFSSKILKSALMRTCNDKKTCIWTVGQMWIHLFISKQSLIFVSIIWSSFLFENHFNFLIIFIPLYV